MPVARLGHYPSFTYTEGITGVFLEPFLTDAMSSCIHFLNGFPISPLYILVHNL